MTDTENQGIYYLSDIVAGGVGQGLNVLHDKSFNGYEMMLASLLRAGGRIMQRHFDVPSLPLLNQGNVAAGIMSGLFEAVVNRKNLNTAIKSGIRASVANILGSEILERMDIEDQQIL
jgi:hypothetical protein